MKTMLKTFYAKPLVLSLAAALLAITTFAGPAQAMHMATAPRLEAAIPAAATADRSAELTRIQTALESKIVQQTLLDYGLSPEETMARVKALSDEQVSQFAAHTDALQAGGNGSISLVALILIIILVILIVQAPVQADRANA